MKRFIQQKQRNSVRLSMVYDNVSLTKEQLALMEERDQAIDDLQFSLDEKDAQLDEVRVVFSITSCVVASTHHYYNNIVHVYML